MSLASYRAAPPRDPCTFLCIGKVRLGQGCSRPCQDAAGDTDAGLDATPPRTAGPGVGVPCRPRPELVHCTTDAARVGYPGLPTCRHSPRTAELLGPAAGRPGAAPAGSPSLPG